MKRFDVALFAVLLICAFAAGCESTSRNDGVSRFAWSPLHGPGSEIVEPPSPHAPPPEEGSI